MEGDNVPSPPPFFRVCGHFTVFNPSRPMALAMLLNAARVVATEVSSSKKAPLCNITDLVCDAGSKSFDPCNTFKCHNGWPHLDCIRTHAMTQTPENDQFVDDISKPCYSTLSHTHRVVETPDGLALLLDRTTVQPFDEAPSISHPRRHVRWTPEEDDILRTAVQMEDGPPHNWKRIAEKYFHGIRNALACKGRWNKSLQPGLARDKWTSDEDAIVLQGHQNGLSWPEIADKLEGRPPEQVRNRFLNDIDPTLNRSPFTEEERVRLYELWAEYGNKWTKIASEMPGRSEKMVKNCWFNAKMSHRRKLRRLAKGT